MTSPCEVCEKRFVGCHGDCDVFKAWSKEQAEQKRKMEEQKRKDRLVHDYVAESNAAIMRKRGRRK